MRLALPMALLLAGCATDRPAFTVTVVEDLGILPLPPAARGRDGGTAGELDGEILWTFGDTFLTATNHIDGSTMLSATAAWALPAAPRQLSHAMDGDQPAQFVPYTAEELAQNRADFQHGYALWPTGLLDVGEPRGLVPFERVQRRGSEGFATVGVGIARVRAGEAMATRDPDLLFAAPDDLYIPQFVIDDSVYGFACGEVGFLDFRCKLARAPRERATERAAWTFFDGKSWQASSARAAYVIDRTAGGPSISYRPNLGRYLAVNCEVVSSTVLLRSADAITGPWDDGIEIEPSASGVLAPRADYNYICIEHPELADADSIVISYSRPTYPFEGDVRLARITLAARE